MKFLNKIIFILTFAVSILLAGFSLAPSIVLAAEGLTSQAVNPENSKQVLRGEKVYMRFCSYCHGKQLEGQPNWFKPNATGKMPAPPHNENGHTWHHADVVLFEITKYGMVPPHADPGYRSDMPAFENTLKDEDIWAVLAFIKSRWPEKNRKFQQEINKSYKP